MEYYKFCIRRFDYILSVKNTTVHLCYDKLVAVHLFQPESAATCNDDILSPAYRYMLINSSSSSHTCLMQVAADSLTHGSCFHRMQNLFHVTRMFFSGFHIKFT